MNWIKNNQLLLIISFSTVLLSISILSLLPPHSTVDLGNKDKISHLMAYFILSFNAMCIINFYNKKLLILACLMAYGFILELIQSYVPGRESSIADGISNSFGVFIGVLIFVFLKKATKP